MEEWALNSENMMLADMNVGPSALAGIAGPKKQDFMRNFDNRNFRLTFHGRNYDLRQIEKALKKLHKDALSYESH